MENREFVTFDSYLRWLENGYKAAMAAWSREREAAEIVRQHGGDKFRHYGGTRPDSCIEPLPPDLPTAPDLTQLAPYSRAKLLISYLDPFHDECMAKIYMVVFTVANGFVEGYVFMGSCSLGRVRVREDQIIECWPSLEPGQVDRKFRDDGLFGVTEVA